MLRLLTDEHISPAVGEQAARRCQGIKILSIQAWEGGHFLSAGDELILQEAYKQKYTLVTFDLRTIPRLLRLWGENGMDHAGVILVDGRTIRPDDIGGLIAALCGLWRSERNLDWTNRVVYLRASL
jgi:hypothetical protein